MSTTAVTPRQFFESDSIQSHMRKILGDKSKTFATSILSIVNSNEQLQKCDPASIYQCALVATTLELPLNQNLGFAYIIPYKTKDKAGNYIDVAQFQIGYKGFIQLAQRSGQFLRINSAPIYEGQIIGNNPLIGYEFDFTIKSEKLVGYAAYFKLLNGYEATLYMSVEELTKHGKKFSQTFKKGFGLWSTDFEGMARKTVIKLLLQRFAPMSIEMQRAEIVDQTIINDADTLDVSYVDNSVPTHEEESERKESNRIIQFIENSTSIEQLETELKGLPLTNEEQELLNAKIEKLK